VGLNAGRKPFGSNIVTPNPAIESTIFEGVA
jgi:hypothetical protein